MKYFKVITILLALLSPAMADWSTYRGDAGRTGYSPEPLPATLSLQWTYKARHAPQPAWTRENRMLFDHAFQPVATADTVFFGSSADDKLYALDAASGKERWTFFTDAPIRFAPVLWKARVFVASDDGVLYCLAAKTGRLLWRKHGGPRRDMVLGHGRMVSRWPARGGPMILDDVLYFGAGIWAAEGIYLYALDPETGEVKWVNDTSGAMVMEQPHGGNLAKNGVSIQGYLAADKERVIVPTGRGAPAAFDRATGKLLNFRHSGRPKPYSGVRMPEKALKLAKSEATGTESSEETAANKEAAARAKRLSQMARSALIVAGDTMVSGGGGGISLRSKGLATTKSL